MVFGVLSLVGPCWPPSLPPRFAPFVPLLPLLMGITRREWPWVGSVSNTRGHQGKRGGLPAIYPAPSLISSHPSLCSHLSHLSHLQHTRRFMAHS
jgi:hypothetical protein